MQVSAAIEQDLATMAEDLRRETGDGCSVVLYGSAARGDWDAESSDLNLLVVVDDPSPGALVRLTPAVVAWHDKGHAPPLLIGRAEWERATDTFPIEITDMQVAHRVLTGPDPVADLRVDPEDLRKALEAAYRGVMIRLRQAYVRFSGQSPVLGGFAAATSSELLVLLRATAALRGNDPGTTAEATITALAADLGPDAAVLRAIIDRRRDPEWSCPAADFAAYLGAITRLAALVDTHTHGAA